MAGEKAITDLKKGKISPFYLLYGDEEYLLADALHQMLDILVPPSDRDFCLFRTEGENTDFDLVKQQLLSPSLLGGRKVVVVKNTTIFQSRENISDLILKIRDNLEANPQKAVRYFLTFLKLTGFAWEDMQGAGWQKITDEKWNSAVEGQSTDDRHKWLPRVVELCEATAGLSSAGSDVAEQFEKLLALGLPAGNCLILTADSVDKRKKIFKLIEQAGVVLHFAAMKNEAQTRESLRSEAQKLLDRSAKSLTAAAWSALGKKTGYQLRPSLNELQKLISYAGDRTVIDERDVEVVVGKTKEDSIFDLTNAISERNALAAISALKSLMDQGEHPLMILTMVSREIRLLLQASILVSGGDIPRFNPNMDFAAYRNNIHPSVTALAENYASTDDVLVRKHPYVIYNALRRCGRFRQDHLIGYLDDLLEMDRSMKSSATDPRLLLEAFLVKACTTAC